MLKDYSIFLKEELFTHLVRLHENSPAKWGKMNLQQMVEHLSDFFKVSTEQIIYELSVPESHLPKYREFLFSNKQFRENTKAPSNIIGDDPAAAKHSTLAASINELHECVEYFFQFFSENSNKKTLHPSFGQLNEEEWIILHHKHATHHLRQFELIN